MIVSKRVENIEFTFMGMMNLIVTRGNNELSSSDNIEVGFLMTVTKEDVLEFYRVGDFHLIFDFSHLDKL